MKTTLPELLVALRASVRECLLKHGVPEPRFLDPEAGTLTGRAAVAEHLGKKFLGVGFAKLDFLPLATSETHAWARFRTPDGEREGIFEFAFDAKGKLAQITLFSGTASPKAQWEAAEKAPVALPPGLTVTVLSESKLVDKPWGYEHWLIHEEAPFACKSIFVKAGSRTSLQFHRRKEEASLLVSGKLRLHFGEKEGAPVRTLDIGPGTLWHVKPGTVHRMEALSDSLFMEVSTTELDDVVRLEDDTGRGDGVVATEKHAPKSRRSAKK